MAATILTYGESGTGKTADVGGLALYIWEKTGKKTRLVSTDSGGWQSVQGFEGVQYMYLVKGNKKKDRDGVTKVASTLIRLMVRNPSDKSVQKWFISDKLRAVAQLIKPALYRICA